MSTGRSLGSCALGLWYQLTGAMIPGQLGPTRRVLFWVLRMSVMRTMSKQNQISICDFRTFGAIRTVLGNTLGNTVEHEAVSQKLFAGAKKKFNV